MIKNLPEKFPISALQNFDFGDAEARDDRLLGECPVPTASINDFLAGRNDIVLGFRGTGKSAIVRLLVEGKLKFKSDAESSSTIVCLDEEFDYRAIREKLLKYTEDERDRHMSCRVVWEILIIYRSLQVVRDQIDSSDSTIKEFIKEIDVLLGVSTAKPKLLEIILSHKKKIGVKLDAHLPNIVDVYAGLEPTVENRSQEIEGQVLKIVDYRKYLQRFLHERKINLYVLFDRLDDFVVHEDYATQKLLIQGLVATQTDYRQKYQNIKIRSFFRTDLFRKVDLSQFGPDKIFARCVELHWSPSELKHLIAKRIAFNLMNALKLNRFEIFIDTDQFLVSRDELPKLSDSKNTINNFDPLSWAHWKKRIWLAYVRSRSRENSGRIQNSSDVVFESIITSIFPREAVHCKKDGIQASIDLFDFFDTHFQFSHGNATPRLMLSFMNKCVSAIRDYYNQNRDLVEIKKNEKGEYPLFVKNAINNAYKSCKKDAWDVQYQWVEEKWKPYLAIIEKFSANNSFSFTQFSKESKSKGDDIKQFLAFVTHTGLLRCQNDRERYEDRIYDIPLLFQRGKAALCPVAK